MTKASSALNVGSQTQHITFEELASLQEQLDRLKSKFASRNSAVTPDAIEGARIIQQILKTRRKRESLFSRELFGEPAWDVLLELYVAELFQQKVSVTSACYASAVAPTTALRWLDRLEKEGWVKRIDDPLDRRRSWVSLTDRASTAMQRYVEEVGLRLA